MHGPAFPLDSCATAQMRILRFVNYRRLGRYPCLGLGKLRWCFQRKRLCSEDGDHLHHLHGQPHHRGTRSIFLAYCDFGRCLHRSKSFDHCICCSCLDSGDCLFHFSSKFLQFPPLISAHFSFDDCGLRLIVGETAAPSYGICGLRAVVEEIVASAQQVPKFLPEVEVFVFCSVVLCSVCSVFF